MRRLATGAWLLRHALMVVTVAGFLGLGWWQVRRAAEGNVLSFGYAIEWPVFAGFVVLIWVREMRLTLRGSAFPDRPPPRPAPGPDIPGVTRFDLDAARADRLAGTGLTDDGSPDYNQYLAWLAAHPEVKPSDYRRHVTADRTAADRTVTDRTVTDRTAANRTATD